MTLKQLYFMVSLLNKSFWSTCHKLTCHTTEYILALDRFSWTSRGVWGPISKEKCVIFFAPVAIIWAGLQGALVSSVVVLTVGDNLKHCFQGPVCTSKYRNGDFCKQKIAIKWQKFHRKGQGMVPPVGDDVGQCFQGAHFQIWKVWLC